MIAYMSISGRFHLITHTVGLLVSWWTCHNCQRNKSLMISAWEIADRTCNSTGCGHELQHTRIDQRCTPTTQQDSAADSSTRCWTLFGSTYSCASMSGGGTLHAYQWENLRAKENYETCKQTDTDNAFTRPYLWVRSLSIVFLWATNINTIDSCSPLGSSST